eukprot:1185828-Prorocentrum_minimum.AAC.2
MPRPPPPLHTKGARTRARSLETAVEITTPATLIDGERERFDEGQERFNLEKQKLYKSIYIGTFLSYLAAVSYTHLTLPTILLV